MIMGMGLCELTTACHATHSHSFHIRFPIPFVHKSLQNYNDFVLTVTRLNGYMNYSLAVVRLPIRKPGPHNSRGSV